jgi:hypothetical protein
MMYPSAWKLAQAAFLALAANQQYATAAAITDDTQFYGQSPPVYPSRESNPLCYPFNLTNKHSSNARQYIMGFRLCKGSCSCGTDDA